MAGGQPARGTELVTVTYMNMPNGEGRGVFVEDGLMVYVTRYHKGIGASGKAKVIHRYLPQEVGELMFYYLWMVLPFWRKLESASRNADAREASPFIWQPAKEEAWARPQRKKRRRLNHEEGKPASTRTERWGTNQVRRAIERVSLRSLEAKLNIQTWRHGTKAIYRRYINDKAILKAVVAGDEDEEDTEDDPFDIQTGHDSKTGGQVYGRPADESPFSTEAQRLLLRRVSLAWHRFLLFRSTLETPPKKGTQAAEARKQAAEEEFRRWRKMRTMDPQGPLERLAGEGSRFRGLQRQVIEVVMQQKSPIVVIMATGAGKSMTFMLPASCSTGVTVVIVPLLSLKGHLKDWCAKAGIDCVEWDSHKPHEWASVVLVTPEKAVSRGFGNFIHR